MHAAAVVKALRKGNVELADAVYSGVPAHLFGLEQRIRLGPMSGRSNVSYWLEKRGIEADDATVERLLEAAKASPRLLEDEEIEALLDGASEHPTASLPEGGRKRRPVGQ